MAKFPIIKSGTKADGKHWNIISKTEGVLEMTALLTTSKPQTKEIEVPDALTKHIAWKF